MAGEVEGYACSMESGLGINILMGMDGAYFWCCFSDLRMDGLLLDTQQASEALLTYIRLN